MEKLKCPKCGWEWIPRTQNPKQCPRCKSYKVFEVITVKKEGYNFIHEVKKLLR